MIPAQPLTHHDFMKIFDLISAAKLPKSQSWDTSMMKTPPDLINLHCFYGYHIFDKFSLKKWGRIIGREVGVNKFLLDMGQRFLYRKHGFSI